MQGVRSVIVTPILTPLQLLSSLEGKESRCIGRQVWVPAITMLALFPAGIGQESFSRRPTQQLNEPGVQRCVFPRILRSDRGFPPAAAMGFSDAADAWRPRLRSLMRSNPVPN